MMEPEKLRFRVIIGDQVPAVLCNEDSLMATVRHLKREGKRMMIVVE